MKKQSKILYGIENINTGQIIFYSRYGAFQDKNAAYRIMVELGLNEHQIVEYKLKEKE